MEAKFDLITRNLQEVLGEDIIKNVLKDNRKLHIYWGTAPTGKIHLGYFVPIIKIADMLAQDCKVTILIADLHAALDNMKSNWEQIDHRYEYYKLTIKQMLLSILQTEDYLENITFVRGTDFQLSKEYTLDMYKLATLETLHDAQRAGTDVVKQKKNPLVSSILYPGMQCLDEEYLKVDAQFGGVDQRKIFILAEKYLPKLGYKKRAHLMNCMIPNFADPSEKMSSSDVNSKIGLDDTFKQVKKKIGKAFCEPGNVEKNALLIFTKQVLFPYMEFKKISTFYINRPEKFGGSLEYKTYEALETAFSKEKLHPADFKMGFTDLVMKILEPMNKLTKDAEYQKLISLAY